MFSNANIERPAIAIVSNTRTPYRLHVHGRVAREIPEVRLHSLFTHGEDMQDWVMDLPHNGPLVVFGQGHSSTQQAALKHVPREWIKAGRIIEYFKTHDIKAAVIEGYNDAARLRLMLWCHRHGIPFFVWGDSNIRGDLATGVRALLKRWYIGRVVRWATGMFACGSQGREFFAKYGARPERIFYYPVEPDYRLIDDLPSQVVRDAMAAYSLAQDRRRIVYSGRLLARKRVDLLIDAFASIASARPQWDLLIVGDGPEREALERRVAPELRHRVLWTGFVKVQMMVTALYKACDVLVLPSDFEPWALVINEAAAAGMAIVASDVVGAAAELIRDGVNGQKFRTGDDDALAKALFEVTEEQKLLLMRAASRVVLEDWRRRGDPIKGLREALTLAGILSSVRA